MLKKTILFTLFAALSTLAVAAQAKTVEIEGTNSLRFSQESITVKPGEKLSLDITADAVGDWAFHCHLLYHMHAGMFQIVTVAPQGDAPEQERVGEHG